MKLNEFDRKVFSDPEIKKIYDDLDPDFQIIYALIETRRKMELTQQDLSSITGIDRADISKIENGNANPTVDTLKRLAKGLGKKLVIKFI